MKILRYAVSLWGLILVQIGESALANAIIFVVFVPICIGIMWLALPHLMRGPDVLVWLVTGLMVLLALPAIYFINKLNTRIDDAMSDCQEATDDQPD